MNSQKKYFKVSEIIAQLKLVIEENFFDIAIQGEVSGFKSSASGHAYFNLKDENALINAVCWRNTIEECALKIEDGMELICHGKISLYQAKSNYQLIVNRIEIAGQGALLAAFEKRKKMLMEEGLFDIARKKILPFLPRSIGIITSAQGAVIQDIIHRINDRFPLEVIIWNVPVQGSGASKQIAAAIHGFNNLPNHITKPDILILARGGGSIEDLWCFNEDEVVRAIAHSNIPIISAIGHETDFTLSDFAADLRAPTPTAAAEFAVPVMSTIESRVLMLLSKMIKLTYLSIEQNKAKSYACNNILLQFDNALKLKKQTVLNFHQRIKDNATKYLEKKRYILDILLQKLEKYDQTKILSRGFSLLYDMTGKNVIKSAYQLNHHHDDFLIKMSDGTVAATVKK